MGAATAWALARRGRSVLVLEQFRVGHERGSSHGTARIFRFSYPEETYVGMAMAALPMWRELETASGEALLTTTGGFDRGKPLDDHENALSHHGADYELMTGRDVARRWPYVIFPDEERVLYQPDGGIVAADRAVAAFVACATEVGAELREGERVLSVAESESGVTIESSSGRIDAAAVVVTAGAWASDLLRGTGISLDVWPTRETIAYFETNEVPPTVVEWGSPSIYALASPGEGIKVGEHQAGPTADPDARGRVDRVSVDRLSNWVGQRFPGASPIAHRAETCLYTNTPDEHFILMRRDSIVVGSPCSGHGFKFAPWVGQRLSDLVDDVLAL